MNDRDRLLNALATVGSPLCDDCVTSVVGWRQRQRANTASRWLSAAGRIVRGEGTCRRCGKTKKVSALVGPIPAASQVTQGVLPRKVPGTTEDAAERTPAKSVEAGRERTDVSKRPFWARGPYDYYVVTIGDRSLVVEVDKGSPPPENAMSTRESRATALWNFVDGPSSSNERQQTPGSARTTTSSGSSSPTSRVRPPRA